MLSWSQKNLQIIPQLQHFNIIRGQTAKADPGPAHTPCTPFEKNFGFVLLILRLNTHIPRTLIVVNMLHVGTCEGASKQSPDPKNSTALPRSEIPGSTTGQNQ